MKTWLITGCSSGLGRHLAEAVLAAGHNAVVTARNATSVADLVAAHPGRALACALDVDSLESVQAAVAAAEQRFGAIDVLVNNAGYSYRGAVEEGDSDEIDALFRTNLFGAMEMIRAVLPGIRARRSGTIVNISSIAGQLSVAGTGFYSATKFALEGLSDALRKELAPLGIRVLIVEPGAFRTDFSGRSLRGTTRHIDDYATTVGPRRKEVDRSDGTQRGDPRKAARTILDVVEGDTLPVRLLLGSDAVAIVTAELTSRLAEIEQWKHLSVATDFPD